MVLASRTPQADSAGVERLSVRSGGCSARGSARLANEDGMFLDPHNRFFVVTDGMGGERAGAVASRMAIRAIGERLHGSCSREVEHNGTETWLSDVLYDTNDLMLAAKGTDKRLKGMGATAVVAVVQGDWLSVASLGDSRAYLIRDGSASQLTTDHSVAQSMVDAGMVPAAKLKSHPFRHVLHQYLGCSELGEGPCTQAIEVQPGDRILLATDGLTGRLSSDLLAEIVGRCSDPRLAARLLMQRAVKEGSTDDITCVTIYIDTAPQSDVRHRWVSDRSPAL